MTPKLQRWMNAAEQAAASGAFLDAASTADLIVNELYDRESPTAAGMWAERAAAWRRAGACGRCGEPSLVRHVTEGAFIACGGSWCAIHAGDGVRCPGCSRPWATLREANVEIRVAVA